MRLSKHLIPAIILALIGPHSFAQNLLEYSEFKDPYLREQKGAHIYSIIIDNDERYSQIFSGESIDFDKFFVVVVYGGMGPTPGWQLVVDSVENDNDAILVSVKNEGPPPDELVISALSGRGSVSITVEKPEDWPKPVEVSIDGRKL